MYMFYKFDFLYDPDNMADANSDKFGEVMKCTICTKQSDENFYKCGRLAFIQLDGDHLRLIARKNYPFFITHNALQPYMICLAHHKFIQNGAKFNEQTQRINLAQYELDDRREAQEFLNEFLHYCETDDDNEAQSEVKEERCEQLSSEEFENLHERYRKYEDYDESSENCSSNKRTDLENSLDALSATALRRYKKYFKLPNRSGATSKNQLLGGVTKHFESILADPNKEVANFLGALHRKSNRLDNPGGSGNHLAADDSSFKK